MPNPDRMILHIEIDADEIVDLGRTLSRPVDLVDAASSLRSSHAHANVLIENVRSVIKKHVLDRARLIHHNRDTKLGAD